MVDPASIPRPTPDSIKIRSNGDSLGPDGRVVIAYLHPGQVAGGFCDSLIQTLMWDERHRHRVVDVIGAASGPRIATVRNEIVKTFLNRPDEPRVNWLMMIDSDMTWPPGTIDAFLELADPEAAPILAGLAFAVGRDEVVRPNFFVWTERPDGSPVLAQPRTFPLDKALKVDAVGACCTLIHRSVLEKIQERYGQRAHVWFAETENDRGEQFGEDVTFCIRAAQVGAPIYVIPWLRFGHLKQYNWGYDDYAARLTPTAEMAPDEIDRLMRPAEKVAP